MRIQADDDMHPPVAQDSPSSNGGRLLLGVPWYARFWPTAAVPHFRRKLPLEMRGCSRERRLTGFVANSHYRPRAEIQWVEFAAGKKPFTWSRQGKLRNKKGAFLDGSAKWSAMLAPRRQSRVAEH